MRDRLSSSTFRDKGTVTQGDERSDLPGYLSAIYRQQTGQVCADLHVPREERRTRV